MTSLHCLCELHLCETTDKEHGYLGRPNVYIYNIASDVVVIYMRTIITHKLFVENRKEILKNANWMHEKNGKANKTRRWVHTRCGVRTARLLCMPNIAYHVRACQLSHIIENIHCWNIKPQFAAREQLNGCVLCTTLLLNTYLHIQVCWSTGKHFVNFLYNLQLNVCFSVSFSHLLAGISLSCRKAEW